MDIETRAPKPWLRITLPAVLIIAWLVLGALGGPTFGKISSVSSNDQASFLPASAESTVALEWQQKFQDSSSIPAIVLVVSDQPLTASQKGTLGPLAAALGAVDGVEKPQPPASSSIAGPIPSQDGKAVEFLVPGGRQQ